MFWKRAGTVLSPPRLNTPELACPHPASGAKAAPWTQLAQAEKVRQEHQSDDGRQLNGGYRADLAA